MPETDDGFNILGRHCRFFLAADLNRNRFIPAEQVAFRGQNIEGIEQFFQRTSTSLASCASCSQYVRADCFVPGIQYSRREQRLHLGEYLAAGTVRVLRIR